MTTIDSNAVRAEIARLQDEVARGASASSSALHDSLRVAWQIGKRLYEERDRLRREIGRRAWTPYLHRLLASERTAQRYMELVFRFPDPNQLADLSLRRAHYYLNITTEPRSRANALRFRYPPNHIRQAQRLLIQVRRKLHNGQLRAENRRLLRQDLAPLHEELIRLFDDQPHFTRPAA